jgi:5-(carboxyamino)imidazole ribonucleotide mutase
VPVATVAINNAHNAAILAAQILAVSDPAIKEKLTRLKNDNKEKVNEQNKQLNNK